ncbi:MAG: ribonuclease P protein component [Alistipes sp.]|nr:ribonuclease P protein component [Alistipes sp.]MBR5812804.1 ribonuclease P protein component [Alistipes sp.]
MPDFSLPKEERLRSLTTIRRLFTEGKGGFVYPFRYTYLVQKPKAVVKDVEAEVAADGVAQQKAEGKVEIMFSVPKKFHKRANKRNLLKRRAREAYRLSREELRAKVVEQGVVLNVALVYSTKELHSYKTISNAVQRILEQIGSRI